MRRDVVAPSVAAGAFVWSAMLARRRTVSVREESIFRAFNDGADALNTPIWAVMQAGSLGCVLATSSVLAQRGERHAAIIVGVVGTAVWGGIKRVKPLIGRGRPEHHVADVNVRGAQQTGLGFPSGHSAVSLTLALIAAPAGPIRVVALGVAAATGGARMYVGAHLPLDVVGGFASAVIVGRATNAMMQR